MDTVDELIDYVMTATGMHYDEAYEFVHHPIREMGGRSLSESYIVDEQEVREYIEEQLGGAW